MPASRGKAGVRRTFLNGTRDCSGRPLGKNTATRSPLVRRPFEQVGGARPSSCVTPQVRLLARLCVSFRFHRADYRPSMVDPAQVHAQVSWMGGGELTPSAGWMLPCSSRAGRRRRERFGCTSKTCIRTTTLCPHQGNAYGSPAIEDINSISHRGQGA